eukprot:3929167-Rhodomonas_salina.4
MLASELPKRRCAICLRARYAMSGTVIACCALCLRARYAMSGTAVPYRALLPHVRSVLTSRIALAGP